MRSSFQPRAAASGMLAAAAAILMWSTLAALGYALAHLPPFLLTGIALAIGSVPGLLQYRRWRVPRATLALGVGGLFGFHFLLFVALRLAPPVEANLVNYLWPLLIVVLTPLVLPGWRLHARHVVAALVGFVGAAIAIGAAPLAVDARSLLGFALAAGSAIVWAGYSLLARRVPPFSSWAIGGFALASSLLALRAIWRSRSEPASRRGTGRCLPCSASDRWAARSTCGTSR